MTVQSIRGVVEAAIQRASAATGVDFSFLLGAARRESGFNPAAKAPGSSAAGLFQFVDQTWLGTLKQHGAKYGYARYAELIQKGSDGRYHVEGAEARRAVMDLRLDPHAASLMAGELASDHASYLRGRVGREPTGGELYAAHFLGPQGSARLIETARATPHASAASLFPDAAASNHAVFYRAGRAVSVSELYTDLTSTAGQAGAHRPPGRRRRRGRRSGHRLPAIRLGAADRPAGAGAGAGGYRPARTAGRGRGRRLADIGSWPLRRPARCSPPTCCGCCRKPGAKAGSTGSDTGRQARRATSGQVASAAVRLR